MARDAPSHTPESSPNTRAHKTFPTQICMLTSYRESYFIEIEPRENAVAKQPRRGETLLISFWAEVHYNSLEEVAG